MGNAGISIRNAITLDPALPALALEASYDGPYIGFYFTYYDDEGQDGEWSYWTADAAEATATNRYYTPGEIRALLVEKGYPADRS